jgi:hypothetical protein
MAYNIKNQLSDCLYKLNWSKIEQSLRDDLKHIKASSKDRSHNLRACLALGFFMNTCRRMPNTKAEGVYITLKDGLSLKLDNQQSNLFKVGNFPEWLVFTQASGTSNGQGLIKMSCSINSEWVDHKLHLLKETDLDQLCGLE